MYWTYRAGELKLSEFTPAQFSPPSNSLFKYDASDISTLYQDTGGTTPVVSDLDPVGRWVPIEAQGSNRVQPLIGTGTYYASTTYGPAVEHSVFREQVSGAAGGAVPPANDDDRFMYAVVSGAGISNSHGMFGYGLGNNNRNFFFEANGANWKLEVWNWSLLQARTVEQAILMAWYDGATIHFRVNDNAPVTQAQTGLFTVSSATNATYGCHISHTMTSGGYGAPSANQLFNIHEAAIYNYVPIQEERDALFTAMNSKWNGIGNTT
jgi:hypothetical protein